jgi:hypothetical protein
MQAPDASSEPNEVGGRGSGGFTIIELVVAVSLLAVVAGGFVASLGLGFQITAVARQRNTAADIAEARLEHLRSIPYSELALASALTHSSDPTNPDHGVSDDGSSYDIDGKGTLETLVVDDSGAVLHFEDPVQVGTTQMTVYQYVTWIDDATVPGTEDYKRVTVIVTYKAPAINGITRFVRASSLFSSGDVSIGAGDTTTTGATTTSSPTTTVAATTTTAPAATCPGDTTGPTGTVSLNGSAGAQSGYTATQNVTIALAPVDTCAPMQAAAQNEGGTLGAWSTYDPVNPNFSWSLTAGDGSKQVMVQIDDAVGNATQFGPLSIILDTTKPTSPGTLTRTVSCSGSNRTVSLSWSIASDTNFQGYRVYRSTDGVSWSVFTQTSLTSASDNTVKKNADSDRYYVVAYDKAGNESNATNTIALSKNQCS